MSILKGVKDRIDVKVSVDVEGDMGRTVKSTFVATYKKPPVSETKELLVALDSDDAPDDESLMAEFLLGWSNVDTTTGDTYEFTPEHVKEMLDVREYRKALVRGFLSVLLGRDALPKN